jgi:ketosteroid isomerase-like protein
MKMRLLGALAGLAIGFALPTFAQEKDTVDPQIREQLDTAGKKYDEAFNKNDAVALAALFTQDAAEVGPNGPVYGQQALEKHYRDLFLDWHPTDHINTIDRVYMLGKDACVIMKWSVGGYKGYVTTINVQEGDKWPVRIATFNITSPPAATPSPTASPSNK